MKYGLFCSEFFTDHFYEVHFGPSGPTYAQNSKNCRKIGKNRPAWDSDFSRLGPKSKNREPRGTRYALDLSKSFNQSSLSFTWPKLSCISWTWSKIENHEYLRGRKSKFFFWPIFLDVFFDVDSDKKRIWAQFGWLFGFHVGSKVDQKRPERAQGNLRPPK